MEKQFVNKKEIPGLKIGKSIDKTRQLEYDMHVLALNKGEC